MADAPGPVDEVEPANDADRVDGDIVEPAESTDSTDDTVEVDLGTLPPPPGSAAAERDEFRDALLRMKAEFENYKKRVAKEQAERSARAAEALVTQLLPVLDACEAAVIHGSADVGPILKTMLDVLEKEGLEIMDDVEAPFDPGRHEAVLHEEGDGEQVVVESLRTGYLWKGRVVRPAMVKVRG